MKLKTQLIGACVAVVAVTFLLSFGALAWRQAADARDNVASQLNASAVIAGDQAIASLQFDESWSAEKILKSLGASDSDILWAKIVQPSEVVFASFAKPSIDRDVEAGNSATIFMGIPTSDHVTRFVDGSLYVQVPIFQDNEHLGCLQLKSSLSRMHSRFRSALVWVGIINLLCLGIAYLLLRKVLSRLSSPIDSLSSTAHEISQHHDYSLRADVHSKNELGELTEAFNHMLSTIESQQEKLRQAERMESVGLLASGVAHDLNNILGPVVGYPGIILANMDEGDPNRKYIEIVERSATKAGGVLQGLLSLARRGNFTTQPTDVNQLVTSTLQSPGLLERLSEFPQVRVESALLEHPPMVHGSDPHLTQLLLNLCINAAEAMGSEGGVLTLTTQLSAFPEERGVNTKIPAGEYLEIRVADTGCGIAPDQLSSVFQPFTSTKSLGLSGTGLGLAIVAGIVRDHDGFIDIESVVGEGTTFTVYLPTDRTVELPDENEEFIDGRGERILVVDDFLPQREMTVRVLQELGYRAFSAESGEHALQIFSHVRPHLVLMDMRMDGLDGCDTYEKLLKLDPKLRCIVVTGDADADRVHQTLQIGAHSCIAKPFAIDTFSRQIALALAGDDGLDGNSKASG